MDNAQIFIICYIFFWASCVYFQLWVYNRYWLDIDWVDRILEKQRLEREKEMDKDPLFFLRLPPKKKGKYFRCVFHILFFFLGGFFGLNTSFFILYLGEI